MAGQNIKAKLACKETIDRSLWPDVFWKEDTSVAKADQAISNYKKAVGEPVGTDKVNSLLLRAATVCSDIGNEDGSYFAVLVHMFEQGTMNHLAWRPLAFLRTLVLRAAPVYDARRPKLMTRLRTPIVAGF